MGKFKVEAKRYDKDIYRIQVGETVVGFAMRMCDDTWAATDTNDRRFGFRRSNAKFIARDFVEMAHNTRRDDIVEHVKGLLSAATDAA